MGKETNAAQVANPANNNQMAFGAFGRRVLADGVQSVAGEKFIVVYPDTEVAITATFDLGDNLSGHTTANPVYGLCQDVTVVGGTAIAYLAQKID